MIELYARILNFDPNSIKWVTVVALTLSNDFAIEQYKQESKGGMRFKP